MRHQTKGDVGILDLLSFLTPTVVHLFTLIALFTSLCLRVLTFPAINLRGADVSVRASAHRLVLDHLAEGAGRARVLVGARVDALAVAARGVEGALVVRGAAHFHGGRGLVRG